MIIPLAYLEKIKQFWQKHRTLCIILFAMICIVLLYSCKYDSTAKQSVTPISKQQAQTAEGVIKGADAAKVPISQEQAEEAAAKIRQAATGKPDSTVATTGATIGQAAAQALKDSGGDFALITDPRNPNKAPVLTGETSGTTVTKNSLPNQQNQGTTQEIAIAGIKPDDPVILQQFNVQAFPKHLTVGHIATYSAGIASLNKVNISPIPLFLPKGGVGYVGPYVGVIHDRFTTVERVDFGIAGAF